MKPLQLLKDSKKGQVNQIGPTVIIFVIAAAFLVLGLIIIQGIRDTNIVDQALSETVVNETLVTVTEAGERVARATTAPGFGSFTVSIVTNITGSVIPATNFTTDANGTVIYTGTTAAGNNNTDWNITYSYTFGDQTWVDTNTSITGLGTFGDFWEILILTVILSIVIGLLIGVFGRRSGR